MFGKQGVVVVRQHRSAYRGSPIRLHVFLVSVALAATFSLLGVASATAATSQSQARKAALKALKVDGGKGAVAVFEQPGALKPGTRVTAAGRSGGPAAAASRASTARAAAKTKQQTEAQRLKEAGVSISPAPLVATVGSEPAWFFYEDQAPYQAYAHPGRVVLVGTRTGKVTVSRTLQWPPLIAAELPRFLQTFAAYRDKKYRAFTRDWVSDAGASAGALSRTLTAPGPLPSYTAVSTRAGSAFGGSTTRKQAADQLAAEHSCSIRVSDTLGDFYDAGPVDQSRARVGELLNTLSRMSPGFVSTRYRFDQVRNGSSLQKYVADLIRKSGCGDVLLYVAGGGFVDHGQAVVNVGTRARPDGRIEQQTVSAATVRAILRANPSVTFKLAVDAPYSGGFLAALRSERNLLVFLSSAQADEGSFTALPDVVDPQGRRIPNAYNGKQLLEFTNRELTGLNCFLNSADEVDAATRATQDGTSTSFLAWMLARAFSLCAQGNLADTVVGGPRPMLQQIGFRSENRAPIVSPVAATTTEDTPVAFSLSGSDPDGDPITFDVPVALAHGTLAGGTGPDRTFTPDPDFNGVVTFDYTVTDSRGVSTPGSVTITVTEANDVPVLTAGEGTATFTEDGPAVDVAPALTATDLDDEQFAGATVALTAGLSAAEDELVFTDQNGISGAFDAATGTLTLSGTASVADYQAALRSVRYRDTSQDPSNAPRTATIRVDDGDAKSAPVTRGIAVTPVNDAPVLGGDGNSETFVEDDTAGTVVDAGLTVSDVDDANIDGARVSITTGLDAAEDELVFVAQRGISGTFDAPTGVLTLTGSASKADYRDALRSVRYRDTNTGDPSGATRTITFRVSDGALDSNVASSTMAVTPSNDAPTVDTGAGAPSFTEGGSAVAVALALTVVDEDDTDLESATVNITGGLDSADDVLALPATPGLSATYTASTGTLAITGSATKAAYRAALRTVTYANTDTDDPSSATRTVSFTVNDGDVSSAAATKDVAVVPVNDAPVLGGGGNTAAFTEDDSASVVVNGGVTIADVDSVNMAGATVTISGNFVPAEDRLVFADQNGITAAAFNTTTGTLTLSGSASKADYQTALRSIRYRDIDADDPTTASRTVSFTVTDGGEANATSNTITSTVTVARVNDAPTVTAGGGSPSFTEGGAAVAVDPGVTVADVDDDDLESASVQITGGLDSADDVLALPATPGLSATYTAGTGTLAITASGAPVTKAAYQAALRTVTYANTDTDDPSTAARTISFTVDDGDVTSSPAATTSLIVVPVNDAPVLGGGAGTASYTEDSAGVAVHTAITVSDVDNANLVGATVRITGNYVSSEDRLVFADQNGIAASAFDTTTGTLTLSGSASKNDYETALRSIRYRNLNEDQPSTAARTVSFTVTDGGPTNATSNTLTSTVSVTPVDDAPTITAGGNNASFTEGASAVVVDPGVAVADVDDVNLESATVKITAGLDSAGDVLALPATPGLSATYTASTGALAITGSATKAAYQAALRTVTYVNTDTDDPSTATRTVAFAVNDGDATSSPAATTSLTVVPVNDAPTLGSGGNTVTFEEDDTVGVIVNGGITVSDVDNANLAGAAVSIGTGFNASEDRLVFGDQNGISGDYDATTGVLKLTGSATKSDYQTALRSIRYKDVNTEEPSTTQRAIDFVVDDGQATSNLSTTLVSNVDVDPHADAPTITAGGGAAANFTEGGSPVVVDSGITVADADDDNLEGATVTIGTGYDSSEDRLAFANQNGITATAFNTATGSLALTGAATKAQYQAALRSITYENLDTDDPSNVARTVSFFVSDGDLTSSPGATASVTVSSVNDAPVLGGGAGSASYTEDDTTGAIVHSAITVSDVDDANIAGATVQITGGYVSAEDRLTFTDQNGITAAAFSTATGTLTLSGSATKADYQTALRSIRYRNLNTGNPTTAARVVSFQVTDGQAVTPTSNTVASSVTVGAVNDAPTITAGSSSASFTEDGSPVVVDDTVTVADPDDTNLEGATVVISGNLTVSEDVLGFSDQNGIAGSYSAGTGTLTLTGSATKAQYQAALRSVTYANTNHVDPSTAVRTVSLRANDGSANSNLAISTVSVVPVDDAPTITTSGGSASFVEATSADPGTGAVTVDSGLTLADGDSQDITGAMVVLDTPGFAASEDSLSFVDTPEITGSYAPLTGTLVLTGTATKAQYQAALRTVQYANGSDTPSTLDRVVSFTVNDGVLSSAAATRTVTVTAGDDLPVLSLSDSAPSFTEAGSPVTVDDGVTVADVDSTNLASATVCICANRVDAEDELVYTPTNGITASAYDPATGTITLTGSLPGGFDTRANFQAALRAVQYRDTDLTTPDPATRGITFAINDGSHDSVGVTKNVGIIEINDPPTLGGGGNTVAYTEDDAATVVNGGLTVADDDDTDIESAKVQITGNFDTTEDELQFAGSGSLAGSYNATTGVLTITGTATTAEYEAALRTVAYVNGDHVEPSSASRTVSFTANDGEEDSDPITTTITVAQHPDAPTLTAGTANVNTFTENGSAVVVDDGVLVADVDSGTLSAATASITSGFSSAQGDVLSYTPMGGISGSYNSSTGVLTLTGAGTKAEYQTALRSVTYSNTSEAPTTSRTISFQVRDEASTASNVATHGVTIQPVNDAPALSEGGTLGYTENDAATPVSPALLLTDLDGPSITGATVSIMGGLASSQDRLSFVDAAPISGSYDAGTGVLTLSGTGTVTQYQAALRAVRYDNTSDDPSTAARTLTYDATDGSLTATTTATVSVTAVNDAPVADDASFSGSDAAIGNTSLVGDDPTDAAPDPVGPQKTITADVLSGDTDVEGDTLAVVPGTFASNDGGSVTMQADGDFTFTPAADTSCSDHSDFFDYTVTDGATPTPGTDTGRVTIAITDCVVYVDNQAPAGGSGRSSTPYNTLAAADTAASRTGDYIYVYKGDGTSTGLTGGVTLLDDQRLVGAAEDLTVAGTALESGADANRPKITGTVDLENANTVEGLDVTATAAPAIRGANAGGADAGGTLDDLVLNGATFGGLSLVNTTGTWDVSNLSVTSTGGDGIRLTSAGTVNFASSGMIGFSGSGRGFTASSTALSGTVDSVNVTASTLTGVSLTTTTGSITFSDLDLSTTGTGLYLNNAGGVTVANGSSSNVTSSGGPAVDLNSDAGTATTPPDVTLATATSSGGASGVTVSSVSGTLSIGGGTLSGHSTAEVSVVGGAGTVSYAGAIGNGSGLSARVDNRTGGTVTVSGNISDSNDAGGGISMSGNSGGSTTFSGSNKTLNTGSSNAVGLAFTGGHTVSLTGGGLDIDTTSGSGITSGSANGFLTVTGTGNTIDVSAGTSGTKGLNVNGPDITASGLRFQRISTTAADDGIVLANTGSAGGLTVTGTGTSASGGVITTSTGPGISLSSTRDVSLSGVNVTNGGEDGIRASSVTNLAIAGDASTSLASAITGNGNAGGEDGFDLVELAGTVTIDNATVTGNYDNNLALTNDAATLSDFTVDDGTYGTTNGSGGNDSIQITNTGSGNLTGAIRNADFVNSRGDHIQLITDNDPTTTSTQKMTIENNTLNSTALSSTVLGGGIALGAGGSATQTIKVDNNDIDHAHGAPLSFNTTTNTSPNANWTVNNNRIGNTGEVKSGSVTNSGFYINVNGNGNAKFNLTNNTIMQTDFTAVDAVQNDGDAAMNITMKGNTIVEPGTTIDYAYGVRFEVGSDVPDNGTSCLDLGDPSTTALKNRFFGSGNSSQGYQDVRVRMAGSATVNLAGYTGGAHDNAAVNSWIQTRNNIGGTPTTSSSQLDAASNYGQVSSCPLPAVP